MRRSRNRPLVLGVALALGWPLSVGCEDRAALDYERCLDREDRGDLAGARKACALAATADVGSRYGRLARVRIPRLEAELDAQRAMARADAGTDGVELVAPQAR